MTWLGSLSGVIASIVMIPLRLLWKPVAIFMHSLYLITLPMLVMGTWAWNTWESFLDFLASLEPIYTFVACGACVGVIAGVSLGVTSSFITSLFGMHRQSYRIPPPTPAPSTPSSERPGTGKTEDSSSYETDWQMLNKPPPKRRRRTPGFWSQTIHEEDDDDSGGF